MRRSCLALLLIPGLLHAQADVFRTWTDAQGRKVSAKMTESTPDKVTLVLQNGRSVTIPLDQLSQPDREWVTKTTGDPENSDRPPAASEWPRIVSLKEPPVVNTVKEDKANKEFIYESEHYEFVCDSGLGANLVREFSKVFETTWLANCLLPLDFKPSPEEGRKKFQARIFTTKDDYMKAGGLPNSAGVYVGGEKRLMLPLDSLGVKMFGSKVTVDYRAEDYETLIHEITHQMMNHWLLTLPQWYKEGAAEYVRLAKYENGRLTFVQQGDRLKKELYNYYGGKFPMVPLQKLMNLSNAEWNSQMSSLNYASALVLTYYFYQIDGDGKGTHLKDYLRAIEKIAAEDGGPAKFTINGKEFSAPNARTAEEDALKQCLLRGRSYEDLQKDVQKALRREGITVEFSQ